MQLDFAQAECSGMRDGQRLDYLEDTDSALPYLDNVALVEVFTTRVPLIRDLGRPVVWRRQCFLRR